MADTLRILVATDNHVGYNERDPVRGDDAWQTFHEIMSLAKARDVDMVLLGGDLFHDNVPTRKSMYNVMRSLRLNCYGDKPCEVEIISDSTEHFDATFGHANYEDSNINVAIPVFSIHGNHDDPSGNGHFASLDILEMSGLINYFGRIGEVENIVIKPVLLQKGKTKLALYGMSNVRDERLHRTIKNEDDSSITFYRPTVQEKEWYNLLVVHQNHHAYNPTNYLPEEFLPSFMDLVVWGHEHECKIEPSSNTKMGFKVMQPGSSVATSLVKGEAEPKQVTILSITGREMRSEPIRLVTVRPFVYRDLVLAQDTDAVKLARRDGHRHLLTEFLTKKVEELIQQAHEQWAEAKSQSRSGSNEDEDELESSQDEMPLPLIRLRVETSAPDSRNTGPRFEIENPQRFGKRFTGRVANPDNVLQVHVKKRAAAARRNEESEELKQLMSKPTNEGEQVRIGKLVQEFLAAQNLVILPQNPFGEAVTQYIDKDDKHAMDMFVNESLTKQMQHLINMNGNDEANDAQDDEEDLLVQFTAYRAEMEQMHASGSIRFLRGGGRRRYKPKPAEWDTEEEGEWEDQPAALIHDDEAQQNSDDQMFDSDATPNTYSRSKASSTRGGKATRGRARGTTTAASTRGRTTTAGTKRTANGAAKATTSTTTAAKGRGSRKKVVEEPSESEAEDDDAVMLDDDEDDDDIASPLSASEPEDSQAMFVPETRSTTKRGAAPTQSKAKNGKAAASAASSARNSRAGSVASSTRATNGSSNRAAPSSSSTTRAPARKAPARAAAGTSTGTGTRTRGQQSQLNFFTESQASILGQGQTQGRNTGKSQGRREEIEIGDDDDDDDDAFEPVMNVKARR